MPSRVALSQPVRRCQVSRDELPSLIFRRNCAVKKPCAEPCRAADLFKLRVTLVYFSRLEQERLVDARSFMDLCEGHIPLIVPYIYVDGLPMQTVKI